MALSDTKLRSIHGKPYPGPQEVSDADGLSARISPKGVIRFQFRYRWPSKAQRLSLGRYPAMRLKGARNITSDLRLLYDKGIDPRTHFKSSASESMTLADCLDYWQENYVKPNLRPNTISLYQSTLIMHMPDAFPGRAVNTISVKQWVDLFTSEEKENGRRARQKLSQLRSTISWCMRRQVIDSCSIMSI